MKKNNVCLLLLLISPLLYGCNNSNNSEEKRTYLCNMLDYDYAILLKENASETEEYVALELQKTYNLCTNKDIEIYHDNNLKNNKKYISIGNTSSFVSASNGNKNINLDASYLNEDGFYIFTKDNNVFINASNDRGVMYGVYEFIEDTLGVKYLTHDATYYPENLKEVSLYSYDKAYVPLFAQRAYLNTPVFKNDFNYVAHMRFNTDYAVMPSYMGGSSLWHKFPIPGHTVESIVPYKNYLSGGVDENGNPLIEKDYREVYQHRYIDGEVVNNFYLGALDLCYTNGIEYNLNNDKSTLNLMVESLKNILNEDRTCEFLHIGQADVAYSCPCTYCSSASNKYRSSGVMIRFINKVEEAVNSWLNETQNGREITFSMFAYSYNVKPPLNEEGKPIDETVIPNKNVSIKYAPIQGDYIYSLDDSRQNDNTRNQLSQWATLNTTFSTWTYAKIYSNYFYYYPHYQSLKNLLKELKSANVFYEFDQSLYDEYGEFFQYLDAYIFSKLCWNIDLDVNDLVNEFCRYYFGEDAYKYVVDFFELMNNHYNYLQSKGIQLDRLGEFVTASNFPVQLMNKACNYFLSAFDAVDDSTLNEKEKNAYTSRLEKAYLTPLYMKLKFYPFYDGVSETAVSELASEFFSLTDKHSVAKYGENALLTIASLKKEYGI